MTPARALGIYGIRRLLLRADERLSDGARTRLDAGKPDDELYVVWHDRRPCAGRTRPGSWRWRRCDAFVKAAKSSSDPELHRLAKTMTKWRTEILAHHSTGASNGPTEAVTS